MAEDREKISTGPNESPINETIAGTGPGVPDDALTPGGELPNPPSDAQVERTRELLTSEKKQKSNTFAEDEVPVEGQ